MNLQLCHSVTLQPAGFTAAQKTGQIWPTFSNSCNTFAVHWVTFIVGAKLQIIFILVGVYTSVSMAKQPCSRERPFCHLFFLDFSLFFFVFSDFVDFFLCFRVLQDQAASPLLASRRFASRVARPPLVDSCNKLEENFRHICV